MCTDFDGPTKTVARLSGMHDVSQESSCAKRAMQDSLIQLIGSYGYRHLETPILEPTDLFLRKSAGELASRIYSFTDPGSNSVSLRPEFTSSIMRHYLEQADGIELPARWQYSGPVFRYEVSHPETSGQFTQVGAELVGSSNVMADVEVLGLAAQVLLQLGVKNWRVELADLDVLNSILSAVGVSERARAFIIGNVPQLRQGRQAVTTVLDQAQRLHIYGRNVEDDYLGQAIDGLDDGQARVVLRGLLQWNVAEQMGQRNPEDVVDRLLRKLRGSDTEDTLRRGLELVSDLAQVSGKPKDVLPAAEAIVVATGADRSAFDRFAELLDLLQSISGISDCLVLDFGLVRDLAYYNGIVFEVKHPEWPGSLGGGGRYDGLAQALGSRVPVPALGFAYNLEALGTLADGGDADRSSASTLLETLVVAEDAGSYRNALEATEELRLQGLSAELEVGGRMLDAALGYASSKGMTQVLLVHHDGRRTTHTVV